ncbi:MAG: Gfo/Idh/MocA family oxidoreductase [Sediminibacterium sp. Gen4]|jgi:predicted dehydrogenase/threonine dehydrogenase-like Zn-dependent dehydrogenase|uniref:bi-domain-containing oxidoreductase n=1 Tax=unclassified Sediminibacterium TaxID=2635961 RepID=UPI0015C09284|nr:MULTISPECIES: bi-domain-containing oxidoreductase [unclassified Sediminibacterium]MBW0161471.1 bi-domain-containing oxidoreductase [Sediminibacterium sp.]MBW0163714.1 bi-domain-containing oxidoreductase [Sediminibacterium sp.]NWK66936.1 Gfo/Idh/MocA family oxidoreductase [Sediminibacterium sp. Gen4]
MKQIIQDLKKGDTILEEIPMPIVRRGTVLIKTHRSLVSLGTEKMLKEFGKGNLITKARQQPDKVKQVLDKIKTEGLMPTLEAVFNKLGEPLPLGYCNAGEVIAVGEGVTEFSIGDRVASNGHHAEVVCVPKNLVAKIPDNVSYEEASFAVIGSIGLQGIRLVNPTLGETVVVIGLGLIGLLTSELLVANGCNVIGFDYDQRKVDLAQQKGVQAFNAADVDVVKIVESLTNQIGADAVLITASTSSNDVISQAAKMSRKRGRIVLVGVIGLDIKRDDFYKKELSFQVSCSYGPGRYDEDYEQKGMDYPIGFVRWTEKRNFETILQAIAKRRITVTDLITERVALKDYLSIYNNLGKGSIASILEYTPDEVQEARYVEVVTKNWQGTGKGVIGIIGAGNFTKMTVMPALKNSGAQYKYISSAGGLTATSLAKKYGIAQATTDYRMILDDQHVDLVIITTRHDLHAKMVTEALQSGKHVFVEKPLAIDPDGLAAIIDTYRTVNNGASVNVGFNRRFSPYAQKAKSLIGEAGADLNMIATMNAGFIPKDVWVQDMKTGGGRIIGEACHFIDLMQFFSGSQVSTVVMSGLGVHPEENTDNAIITLRFENGAQGVIHYFSNGSKSYPKERIELYTQGRTLVIDNFRKMSGYGFGRFSSMRSGLDKGHKTQFKTLVDNIKTTGHPLIPFEDIVNTTKASFAALESLRTGSWVQIQ